MQELSLIQKVAVWALPILLAITLHEVAHGWVARRLGDPTAMMLGRLTLNPLKHIDPVGTVVVPVVLLALGGFIFGWAKPVPVNYANLRHPKRDMAIVAAAGPGANLLMACGWALAMKLALALHGTVPWVAVPLGYMALAGIFINVVLAVLNLLPVPPLDGGRVMAGLLPDGLAAGYARLEPWGLLIVLALLATGLLGRIMGPPVNVLQSLIFAVFGL